MQARSVKHAALIGGDHVLDVNKCIFSTVHLKKLESLLNQVAKVIALALTVIDLITQIYVRCLEQVHNRENLTVVGHEGLADGVAAEDKVLQDVEGGGNDGGVTGVQGR